VDAGEPAGTVDLSLGATSPLTLSYNVSAFGNPSDLGKVAWAVESGPNGPTAADFGGSMLPSGTLTYAGDGANAPQQIQLSLSPDAGSPIVETFTITLSTLVAGDALGSEPTLVQTVDQTPACFAEGTRLQTPSGWIAVEDLREGDIVSTAGGGAAPVVWIGRRAIDCAAHPAPHAVQPIRIAAGAFGQGRPCRDLFLSPEHAVFVDGVLVPARLLANGASIKPVAMREVVYFHVELPAHGILLAEDLAVESFLDTGGRAGFADGRRAPARFDVATIWECLGAAPLVLKGPRLAAARRCVPFLDRSGGSQLRAA
jgi:hypothetical protein